MNVPTKGFLNERLEISARIDETQTAKVTIHSSASPDELQDTVVGINGLTFYYDLSGMNDTENSSEKSDEVANV